jgi:hypothetical protein
MTQHYPETIFRWSGLSEETFEEYIEKRLPRIGDRELFQELMKVFEESGKDGLRKHLQNMFSQLEEG